jgi:hypothetical protein
VRHPTACGGLSGICRQSFTAFTRLFAGANPALQRETPVQQASTNFLRNLEYNWHSPCISDTRADKLLAPNRKTLTFTFWRLTMNTLMIKDLSITEQLDSKAMSAVRGGTGYYPSSSYFNFSPVFAPNNSKKVDATQLINTELNLQNANGNNVAFATGISSTVNPYISTSNNIHV